MYVIKFKLLTLLGITDLNKHKATKEKSFKNWIDITAVL